MQRITIKGLKLYPRMSEETNAYTASIYLDGKLICTAKNDGKGGADSFDPIWEKTSWDDVRALDAIAFQQLDKTIDPNDPYADIKKEIFSKVDGALEILMGQLIEQQQIEKVIKNHQPTKIVCLRNGNIITVSLTMPLSAILLSTPKTEVLKNIISKKLTEGYKVLNTNIPFLPEMVQTHQLSVAQKQLSTELAKH